MPKRKRPAKHAEMPQYASIKPYNSPDLQRAGYKARELLNFTAKAFHSLEDADLSSRQRDLRGMFIKMFNDRKHKYGKAVSNEQIDIYEKDMRRFMHCIGGFFFFGCLERHIELETGMDIVSMDDLHTDPTWESRTASVEEEDGEHLIQIWLNLGRKNQLHDLETLIGYLIHEMVHAWYLYFSCRCESCHRDRLNTTGHPSDQHGPLFLMLHRLIVSEIRRWDPALENFLTYDCPKDDISQSAKKSFHHFMAELSFDERRKYNKVRSLKFGTNYIALTDDDKVIVRPVLRINHLKREDALRKQILWEKGKVEDMSQYEATENEEGSQVNKGSVRSEMGSEAKE
jgi:hypothetical protein